MARCAMPSPARKEAPRGWRPWSAATSLSCRWMTRATGIAITTSSPTCSPPICMAEQPDQVADAASARERVVRAAWVGGRCDPPRAGRRGFRARGGSGRAGGAGHAPESTGGHGARLAQGTPRRGGPRRPVLSAVYAWALLAGGELEGVEDRLRDAERWLDTTADRSERPDVPAAGWSWWTRRRFAVSRVRSRCGRAGQALARGDVAGTVTYARRALDLAPEDDHLRRGSAAALLGLASWASGDLEAAHRSYADGMAQGAAGREHL